MIRIVGNICYCHAVALPLAPDVPYFLGSARQNDIDGTIINYTHVRAGSNGLARAALYKGLFNWLYNENTFFLPKV